jgi:hypothetical protein
LQFYRASLIYRSPVPHLHVVPRTTVRANFDSKERNVEIACSFDAGVFKFVWVDDFPAQ